MAAQPGDRDPGASRRGDGVGDFLVTTIGAFIETMCIRYPRVTRSDRTTHADTMSECEQRMATILGRRYAISGEANSSWRRSATCYPVCRSGRRAPCAHRGDRGARLGRRPVEWAARTDDTRPVSLPPLLAASQAPPHGGPATR